MLKPQFGSDELTTLARSSTSNRQTQPRTLLCLSVSKPSRSSRSQLPALSHDEWSCLLHLPPGVSQGVSQHDATIHTAYYHKDTLKINH